MDASRPDDPAPAQAAAMSGPGIGEQLSAAREERGLTLDDVERDTRISRRYLQALEDERFGVIPAPVYARGFLRSYSQYLGIEPATLLARFPQDTDGDAIHPDHQPLEGPAPRSGPSVIVRSPNDDPMIGIDIGRPIHARPIGVGPFPFARAGLIAAVALTVTAFVVVLALLIANLGGDDEASPSVPAFTATPEPEPADPPASSGLDVTLGVVPNVIGQPEDIAVLAVEEAGFVVTVVRASNQQYPRGTVFEQAPTAGVEQDLGRAVFIAVSEGPE